MAQGQTIDVCRPDAGFIAALDRNQRAELIFNYLTDLGFRNQRILPAVLKCRSRRARAKLGVLRHRPQVNTA